MHASTFSSLTRKLALACICVVGAVGMGSAFGASDAHCTNISNSDQRNFCRAKAKKSVGHCNAILEKNKRHYCLGLVKRSVGECNAVTDKNLRNQCLGQVR